MTDHGLRRAPVPPRVEPWHCAALLLAGLVVGWLVGYGMSEKRVSCGSEASALRYQLERALDDASGERAMREAEALAQDAAWIANGVLPKARAQ